MMIDIHAFRRALLFESLQRLDVVHLKMFLFVFSATTINRKLAADQIIALWLKLSNRVVM